MMEEREGGHQGRRAEPDSQVNKVSPPFFGRGAGTPGLSPVAG